MSLKKIRRQIWQKIGVFDSNNRQFCRKSDHILVVEKNAKFFAEN
jgi:hypothetical protein